MKQSDIQVGRSYVNKSGRTERRVLEISAALCVTWYGAPETEPKGEAKVRFVHVHTGNTVYRKPNEAVCYLSAFARWADRETPTPADVVEEQAMAYDYDKPWAVPCWSDAGRIHDWRNYVSKKVQDLWPSFSDEQKEALYEQADEQAGQEHWE